MTEARGDLQEAPREGAADLVACAPVTLSSLPPGRVSLCRPTDLLAKLHSLGRWKSASLLWEWHRNEGARRLRVAASSEASDEVRLKKDLFLLRRKER